MLRLSDLAAGHPGRDLLTGVTPVVASQADTRFSYRLFVPTDYSDAEPPLSLWVFVHGTERRTEVYLDSLAELATRHRAVVLTPLFPAAIDDPDDMHNFKMIEQAGVRYDHLLLSVIEEVAYRYHVVADRFFLHGYSGGGQYVLRFLYLHPDRLDAVSIGAPGRITLPDESAPWWEGVGDLEERFGVPLDREAIARVPTQIVIGERDRDPAVVYPSPGGPTRMSRAEALRDALLDLGARVQFDLVPDVEHDAAAVLPAVTSFLRAKVDRPRRVAGD